MKNIATVSCKIRSGGDGVLRRGLAALLLMIAVIAVMPMLNQVLGFSSATVTNYQAGTYYPETMPPSAATPFIWCQQDPDPNSFKKGQNPSNPRVYSGNYFRCFNNWGTAVTISWSAQTGGTASGVSASGSATVAAGAQGVCVPVTITLTNTASSGTVRWRGAIDQADLYAEVEFVGDITVANTATPTECV